MLNRQHMNAHQSGFTLVELMVGLVIGLLTTMVIMQVFSAFEGQKRSTTGTADAQTNGSIAMMTIQQHVQTAGYGLPMPNSDNLDNSLRCGVLPAFVDPVTGDTTDVFPVEITNNVANGSDSILVRFSTTALGAVPVDIVNPANAAGAGGLTVTSNMGCADNDIAMIVNGSNCALTKIQDANGSSNDSTHIRLYAAATPANSVMANGKIACMGNWQDYTFALDANGTELQLNGQSIVSEVVSMQAQYGVSATAGSNDVTSWVDAEGIWASPNVVTRNRIKAIRIALVLRNNLQEKQINGSNVTTALPIAWTPMNGSAAPVVDLDHIPNWGVYRYRTFETIIPIRNMLWSKDAIT